MSLTRISAIIEGLNGKTRVIGYTVGTAVLVISSGYGAFHYGVPGSPVDLDPRVRSNAENIAKLQEKDEAQDADLALLRKDVENNAKTRMAPETREALDSIHDQLRELRERQDRVFDHLGMRKR